MKNVGVIGVGDMGSGIALNLIKNGFNVFGCDLLQDRQEAFKKMGGSLETSIATLGKKCDAVFVMVMNGDQAKSIIFDKDGLAQNMSLGSTIILSATIKPSEAKEIGHSIKGSGINLIDTPVSGGFPGAQSGTLTLMASAAKDVLEKNKDILEAISSNIHHVGTEPGQGQIIKACLQSLIGAQFSATFEAAALAAKAGISGEVLHTVFSTSSAGCGIVNNALEKIIDRKFEGTGSHINTMHKDLTISLNLAENLGVPMHTASAAMQIFHAGRTKYPNGDNWVCTRVIEEIVGAELHR
jgi:3-hydroxyisobutyrate dehydrogenase/putative dehydrogenase